MVSELYEVLLHSYDQRFSFSCMNKQNEYRDATERLPYCTVAHVL